MGTGCVGSGPGGDRGVPVGVGGLRRVEPQHLGAVEELPEQGLVLPSVQPAHRPVVVVRLLPGLQVLVRRAPREPAERPVPRRLLLPHRVQLPTPHPLLPRRQRRCTALRHPRCGEHVPLLLAPLHVPAFLRVGAPGHVPGVFPWLPTPAQGTGVVLRVRPPLLPRPLQVVDTRPPQL